MCRALVVGPKLVLADEPTANLDPHSAGRVLDALDRYATSHDATLVVVTHDHGVLDRFEETVDIASIRSMAPAETVDHA